jgi:hypothetical protein
MRENYSDSRQTLIGFSHATHDLVGATRTADGADCALSLVSGFVEGAPVIASDCVEALRPPNFVGDDFAPLLLGTQDYWTTAEGEP